MAYPVLERSVENGNTHAQCLFPDGVHGFESEYTSKTKFAIHAFKIRRKINATAHFVKGTKGWISLPTSYATAVYIRGKLIKLEF